MDTPEDEELEELLARLPTAERVAARAQALTTLGYRADLERHRDRPDARSLLDAAIAWCEHTGLRDEFEAGEWQMVQRPLGRLSQRDFVDASWGIEAAAALAWALDLYALPDYEQAVDPSAVVAAVKFLDEAAADLRSGTALRPLEELVQFNEECVTLHWRLREFSLHRTGIDFKAVAARCQWIDMRLDHLRLADGDLSVAGAPLVAAAEDQWRHVNSITSERHRASEWLLGQDPVWSEVTTDT